MRPFDIIKHRFPGSPREFHFARNGRPLMYHVGISGGKDSGAALLWMTKESGIPPEQIEATACETGNEVQPTYDQIALLSERVHPVTWLYPELGFYDLARKKKRFPSAKARFCTQELKMVPTARHIAELEGRGFEVVAVSGVRADESEERSKLPEWSPPADSYFGVWEWRPLLRWKIEDVFLIHRRHGIPLNSLYAEGAQRVGCFPCIMSRKAEMRLIAKKWPERIAFLREQEQSFPGGRFSSFFRRTTVPEVHRSKEIVTVSGERMKVPTIDDVVRWSNTTRGGKAFLKSYRDQPQQLLIDDLDGEVVLTSADVGICPSQYGACE